MVGAAQVSANLQSFKLRGVGNELPEVPADGFEASG
jgi:hypothetical protein